MKMNKTIEIRVLLNHQCRSIVGGEPGSGRPKFPDPPPEIMPNVSKPL